MDCKLRTQNCGGCPMLSTEYAEQLKKKESAVRALLGKYGPVAPIRGMERPYHYRNKVISTFAPAPGGKLTSGIYAARTHKVLPVESCLLQDEVLDKVMLAVRAAANTCRYQPFHEDKGTGLLRHCLLRRGVATGQVMVVLVTAQPVLPGAKNFVKALLAEADCIIYAGSLVNPALLGLAKPGCAIYNSAEMTLEQVLDTIRATEQAGGTTVRLHTGDPCLYGAIREQMDALDADGIPYDDTPGVSSFCGAAAALCAEYTLPNVSQTVIITRMEGRTPVPEAEQLAKLAAHGATMVIFLSIGLVDKVQQALLSSGGYRSDTPAAVVYKATWPEQKVVRCTVSTLAEETRKNGITKTALIVVGDFLGRDYDRSKLYDPAFTTEFRQGTEAGK